MRRRRAMLLMVAFLGIMTSQRTARSQHPADGAECEKPPSEGVYAGELRQLRLRYGCTNDAGPPAEHADQCRELHEKWMVLCARQDPNEGYGFGFDPQASEGPVPDNRVPADDPSVLAAVRNQPPSQAPGKQGCGCTVVGR